MKDIMDNGKILLINVSKGRIGEDNSALLGAMLITKLQLAAMDRASIPEEERRDFYLYVDEFQNFATESFATILSEARKYRLNLIIAHQYITQMEEVVRDAVFGNVGTIISFRIGAFDAEYMEKEFEPYFMQTDLVNLDKFNAYVKLMINGVTSAPFSMQTIPPVHETYNSKEKVIAVSRERYSNKRQDIEEKIARWAFQATGDGASKPEGGQGQQRPAFQQGNKPPFDNAQGKQSFQERRQQQNQEYLQKREPHFAPSKGGATRGKPEQEKQALQTVKSNQLEDVVIQPATQEVITDLAGLLGKKNEASAATTPGVSPLTPGVKTARPQVQLYPAICSNCGKNTEVPFKPDPEKEVFCKECYDKRRVKSREDAPRSQDHAVTQQATPAVQPKPIIKAPVLAPASQKEPAPLPPKPKPPTFTPPRPPKL